MKKYGIDQGLPRPDAHAKVTGKARYVNDYHPPKMLIGGIVGSPVASGRIKSIDVSEARRVPGIHAVLTADDLPGPNSMGIIYDDQPVLVKDRVRMVGDRLVLIAGETREAVEEAKRRVKVDIEPLPGLYDVTRALDPDAPVVNGDSNLIREFKVIHGDVESAAHDAEITISGEYHIGGQEHAYLEPQGTLAFPEADGSWTVYVTAQCPFYVRAAVARFLKLPISMVHVVQTVTGGGFGGKEDYPNEPAVCAAALAKVTGRPVKLIYARDYDMQVTTKRHPMVIRHTLHARRDGKVVGVDLEILVDAGAYAGLSTVVAERANISSVGPYEIPNIRVSTKVLYTNNLFGGPYRGFGAPQVAAAHESQMDRLASALGMDPFEVRRINGVSREHPMFASGENLPQAHIYPELLDRLEELSGWKQYRNQPASSGRYREGIGIGTIIYGVNLHSGGQRLDRSAAYIIVQQDGSVNVAVGVTEMGQGALAAMRTMAARALGISEDLIYVTQVDTNQVPDSGPTVASRATVSGGRAILDAVSKLRPRFLEVAADMLGVSPGALDLRDGVFSTSDGSALVSWPEVTAEYYVRRLNPAVVGWFRSPDREYDHDTGQGRAYMFYAFAGHAVRVRVDTETGKVDVLDVTAVHDVGRVISEVGIEGQVHGGVIQGLGWALLEEFRMKEGRMLNAGFTDYLIPTAMDAPADIKMYFIEDPEPQGPFGAKGIGEPSFISVGAAVMNAVYHALGTEVDILPLTPENVWRLMNRSAGNNAAREDEK